MAYMETKAQSLIEEAMGKVRQLLLETDREVEHLLDLARKAGQKQGIDQGLEWDQKLKILQEKLNREISEDVLKSSVHVAESILNLELERSPESVSNIALKVLSMMPDADQVFLRANPKDVEFLKADKERLINGLERAKDIDIRADKQVLRGGLLVQTEHGVIDAQMSTQLEEIARAIGVPSGAYY